MRSKIQGLLGGWSGPVCLTWLITVLAFAWLFGAEEYMGTGRFVPLLVASPLGLTLGVAMVKEHRAARIFALVASAAVLATVTTFVALPADQYSGDWDGPTWVFWFSIVYLVVLGVPIIAGALVGRCGD